jgi:hypothetical protein
MNSGISIEPPARLAPAAPAVTVTAKAPSRPEDGFRPWHFFVLISILLATVTVVMTRRSTPENLILLSVTVAAAGAAAAALYRMLLPLTSDIVVLADEPLSERRRATLEKDKMLALRAIKELEFDRAMGKLSQKDFDEMAGRLRRRALALMKELDEGAGYGPVIEEELRRRLASPSPAPTMNGVARTAVISQCACGTINDIDAVFCKACGKKLAA